MKHLYTSAILWLLPILLYGQRDIPTLESKGITGPVKAVYEKVMRVHQEGDSIVERTADSRTDLKYNELGQLTERISYMGSDPWEIETYSNDETGNLIESLETHPKLRLVVRWTYEYDLSGNLLKEVGTEAEGTDPKQWGGVGSSFSNWECVRDEEGRMVEYWNNNTATGERSGHMKIQYEDGGRKRSEYIIEPDSLPFLRRVRRDISDDSVVFIEYTMKRSGVLDTNHTLVVFPNEHDIVQYGGWRTALRIGEDRWEANQVDRHGNWTKRSYYSCYEWKGEWKRQIMFIAYRRIEYFPDGSRSQDGQESTAADSPMLNDLMDADGR